MAIRLTKTSKVLFAIAIIGLSVALGFLVWRVNQESRLDPTDGDANQCPSGCYWHGPGGTCTGEGGCVLMTGSSCSSGLEEVTSPVDGKTKLCCDPCVDPDQDTPTPPPLNCHPELEPKDFSFNKAPTTNIGPFPVNSRVVLHYNSFQSPTVYTPKVTLRNASGFEKEYILNSSRIVTDMEVKAGENITLVSSYDFPISSRGECAPSGDVKNKSFGWIRPNSDGTCGSGLLGPPQSGVRTPYAKLSISTFRSGAQGYRSIPNGEQCWADSREWPGDYDFNDYFLMISYEADAPVLAPNLSITKTVVEMCIDEDTPNPKAELTYTITVKNTGDGEGAISRIEDVMDSKVQDSFVQTSTITAPGTYANKKINWDFSPALSIAAGASKTYTYKLVLGKDYFGTYTNSVTLTPVGSASIVATANIAADCEITDIPNQPGEVPQTSIFDSTASRIAVGFVLVFVGVMVYNLPNKTFVRKEDFKYREKFEKKVANM